ncbi:hypothetical protein ACVW1A_007854 [Bradyrhizobium sp. LB1.3]|uniref:hypothetical protein n=1 Tax=unclassified Bradyrhizobium TaxID=2631580 RepID=UPI001FF7DEDB|nr:MULTISPECIES: hypothetical protein [unclassified Bradyrhizobium]MCK1336426.1 hypothetical protein [Bradyrhizobium sp. 38]MCK1775333.1 hypothetical protein [Bradyrhizobium sp. 132]
MDINVLATGLLPAGLTQPQSLRDCFMKTARSIMSAGYFFRFYFPFIFGSFMVAPGLAELGLLDAP